MLKLVWTIGLLAGCGSSWVEVPTVDAFRATGLERAGFELGCPRETLRVVPLTKNSCLQRSNGAYACPGEQVGVEGCGKKTTYVFPPHGQGDNWLRDGEVLNATPAAP